MRCYCFLFLLFLPVCIEAQPRQTQNVFLITLDGLRWQELFTGADAALIRDEAFVQDTTTLIKAFWAEDADTRRHRLLPFFWEVIAPQGQLYGNRARGSEVNLTNTHRFSYPGYNEILTGFSDDARIDSNDKVPNPNVTVLEFIHQQDGFAGKVAAFASWDVFPYIVNETRSGIPVNAGFEAASGDDLSPRAQFLNILQAQVPSPWATVRLDAFTHHYALEYLKAHRPRVVYIAYGETDDFAHDGQYDAYLYAAHRTDAFLRELWNWVQANPGYRNQTTFVITTDHGRGSGTEWTGHGDEVDGAEQIWIAVLGPDTPPLGAGETAGTYTQSQVAQTVASLLGITYTNTPTPGPALPKAQRP